MSHSKPQELVRVKQLIELSKLNEAEQLIKRFEEKKGHSLHDKVFFHLLKCKLLYDRGLYNEVVKLAEKAYKESLGLGKHILSVDILLILADALLSSKRDDYTQSIEILLIDRVQKIINKGEELLKTLTLELPVEIKQRKAYIAWLKGGEYFIKLDSDQALKHFKLSLSLREELGNKMEIAWSLCSIARVFLRLKNRNLELSSKFFERGLKIAEEGGHKGVLGFILYFKGLLHRLRGELDRRIIVSERALTIFRDISNKFMEARVLATLGECYAIKGEIGHSIRFFEQSLKLSKEINYKWAIADALGSLSYMNHMKGDLDRALEYVEQAMVINHEIGALPYLAMNHDALIQVLIDIGDFEKARNSLRDLEHLITKVKHKRAEFLCLFDKALVLKTSSRALNRGKAEEILKDLLKDERFFYEDRLIALVNLCEILLADLQITNDVEILEEIKPLIEQLLILSENSHSFWILGEAYLLQAKLALINFDVTKARQFLTQAQKIAESNGIKRLAMKISQEHDDLLKQLTLWENLKESEAPLSERWKLAGLNTQIEKMARKRIIESPNISKENPVMILILTEGGNLLFSKKFISDFSFEDDILGSFLTTINYFISEVFSEGLDRAVFGQYTLIMMPLQPFVVCYIFKGDSYYAHHKIENFIDSIQNDNLIRQSLQNFFQKSKSVQIHSIPSLESLITEIFIEKKK